MLQQEKPEDFVIATGKTTSVREFVKTAFSYLGVSIIFEGTGLKEIGIIDAVNYERFKELKLNEYNLKVGDEIVAVDEKYYRPAEVDELIGDSYLAREKLHWNPKYDLNLLVEEMIQSDLKLAKQDQFLKENGMPYLNYNE